MEISEKGTNARHTYYDILSYQINVYNINSYIDVAKKSFYGIKFNIPHEY